MREVGKIIVSALSEDFNDEVRAELLERSQALMDRYPLYPQLSTVTA